MSREQTRPPRAPVVEGSVGPTYDEAQVAAILRRAAELERGRASHKPELTLAEIEAIARDAGLDPEMVRLAARSLPVTAEAPSLARRLFGGPLRHVAERVIDGELDAGHHDQLLADLRSALPAGGQQRESRVASVGRALTATGYVGGSRIELTLTPREGKTLLRLEVLNGQLAGGFYGGLMGGLGGGMTPLAVAAAQAAHLGAPGMVAAGAGFLGAVFVLARSLFGWRAGRSVVNAEKLADSLAERVAAEVK